MSLESVADFYGMSKEPLSRIIAPDPVNPIIDLTGLKNSDNLLFDAILHTYDPMSDFERLKASPATFKQQRNNYPLRREYFAYKINADIFSDVRQSLLDFGFAE